MKTVMIDGVRYVPEQKEEPKPWPQVGNQVWYNAVCNIGCYYFKNDLEDKTLLATNVLFKSEEQIERFNEILDDVIRMNEEQGWVAQHGSTGHEKWFFYYNHTNDKVEYSHNFIVQSNQIYMSKQTADAIKDKYGDDCKLLAGVR